MSARNCPECGGLVASTINVCPHCGYRFEGAVNDYKSSDNTPKSAPRGENPYNSIAWGIISLILFWPCGIVSLIYYLKSDSSWCNGDVAGAQASGATSIRWAKASIWIAVISIVISLLIFFLFFSFALCYEV